MHPFVRVCRGSVSRFRFVVLFFRGSVSCTFVVPFRVVVPCRGFEFWFVIGGFNIIIKCFLFPTVSPLMLFYSSIITLS